MDTSTQEFQEKSFFKAMACNLVTGWQVVFSESKWIFIRAFRRWEIKQLRKRLNEEYLAIGKLFTGLLEQKKPIDPQHPEAEMSIKQISFLKEEIEHMENELVSSRKDYIARRTQK
ncbi:MAG: hypothetical protein PHO79_07735 [Desulfoplanes sp.]|nr:hypothetical protein [Desulfoplanes sp.]